MAADIPKVLCSCLRVFVDEINDATGTEPTVKGHFMTFTDVVTFAFAGPREEIKSFAEAAQHSMWLVRSRARGVELFGFTANATMMYRFAMNGTSSDQLEAIVKFAEHVESENTTTTTAMETRPQQPMTADETKGNAPN